MHAAMDATRTRTPLDELLREVKRIGALPLDLAETLPAAAYTDPDFFHVEMERVLKAGWVCVAHASQLAQQGDYLSLNLLGELAVVVNDGSRIRALSRVCLHRWAPICEGSGNTRNFVCPFHKWAYGLDGRLIGAPLMDQASAFELDRCTLPEFRTEMVGGFVYVNVDGNAAPLAPALADMSELLANYQTERLVIGGTLEYECKFNWKIMVETFMECYHHIGPHIESFEQDFPARISYIEDSRPAWTRGFAVARPEIVPDVFEVGLPRFPLVTAEECSAFGLYLIYPCHLLAPFPDRVVWFNVQPIAADMTRLTVHQMVQPETLSVPGFAKEMEIQNKVWDVVNLEDIAVNTSQQAGALSGVVKPGRLSHLEKAIWQLGSFVAGKVAGNPLARHR